jgi:hypothetical protein
VICECEVVWTRQWAKKDCHEPGMGLRFLDLPEHVGDAIDEWIQTLALDDCLWN